MSESERISGRRKNRAAKQPLAFAHFFMNAIRACSTAMRAGDWIIIGTAVAVVIALAVVFFGSDTAREPYAEITTSHNTFIYNLREPRTITLAGPVGETTVVIADNSVDVTKSPGDRQICVDAAPISRDGQWLACLPNRVFIRVYGAVATGGVDALSF